VVDAMRSAPVRASSLLEQQSAFYAGDGTPEAALAAWRSVRTEREGTYMEEAWRALEVDIDEIAAARANGAGSSYGDVALDVLEALSGGDPKVLILNVANRGSLPYLDDDAVVEVPCVVGPSGAHPTAMGDAPLAARGLIETLKEVERTTIEAALHGSRTLALRALALHPLVPSVDTARRLLEAYLERYPSVRREFA
jgi:6-phospho-beta-glucosidase